LAGNEAGLLLLGKNKKCLTAWLSAAIQIWFFGGTLIPRTNRELTLTLQISDHKNSMFVYTCCALMRQPFIMPQRTTENKKEIETPNLKFSRTIHKYVTEA